MPKTITLTSVQIVAVNVDMATQKVEVHFCILDSAGALYQQRKATFWRTLPSDAADHPDYAGLPAKYLTPMAELITDLQAALNAKYL